jgi:hypothetical protein
MKRVGEKRGNKFGQVTIFIIIALVIVALVVLVFLFLPKTKSTTSDDNNPYGVMQTCLEDKLGKSVDLVSSQGGSTNPQLHFLYKDEKLEYLCYTNEYYKTCAVQQPLLTDHIEKEIKNDVKSEVDSCLNELESNFKKKGYTVNLKRGGSEVELLPKRVVLRLNSSLTLTKGNSESYDGFSIVLNNNLYELAAIANSIIKWETTYGDSETTVYMTYYRDLKVEKYKQEDGTKVYILTDRNTENKFQFATRSLAWPSGYGIGEVVS